MSSQVYVLGIVPYLLQITKQGFKLRSSNFQKKQLASFTRDCATKATVFGLGGWVGRVGGAVTTKAIYGTLTKDYAWMGLSAFDAFQDGQTEA